MHDQLCAGKAELVITPPLGVSMAGYYRDRRADDILDDLYARALVLSLHPVAAAIVVCDVIGLERAISSRARDIIAERTGIPSSHVMICCTHTHTGPILSDWAEVGMYADPNYIEILTAKIADAVQLAFQRQQPVFLQVGRGLVEGIAFNRRYWMIDGILRTNPPAQSPDIDHPAGPIDPELGILLVRNKEGVPMALVNAYALHADEVGGTAFCADYQGVESRLLKRLLGADCAVLCPNGCCGDINHLDISRPADQQRGIRAAERSGRALAGETVKQLSRLKPVELETLRASSRTFQAQVRVPSPQDVAWAEKAVHGDMRMDTRGLEVVKAHRILKSQARDQSQIPVEVSAISIGGVAIVGLPGEIFCEHGLAIKRQSPFPYTFVAELCNDAIGYVPTRAAYDEGGYEATSSRLQPGTGEQMVQVAIELLTELACDDSI